MNIDGFTRIAAVVANPIKHSNSPFIHNMAFDQTNTNGVYVAFEVEPNDLSQTILDIKRLNMYGINLSMPYKKAAVDHVDRLVGSAKLIGAINTIVLEKDSSLSGYSTDGLGFFKSIKPYKVKDEKITILGGGGAALSIIAQAVVDGAREISVFNRKSENFSPLKDNLQKIAAGSSSTICLYDLSQTQDLQEEISSSSLLVNATSLGMDGKSMPISKDIKLHAGIIVVDIIYQPFETELLKWAKKQGVESYNGLGMLVEQALLSFELWTGEKVESEKIREALEEKIYGIRS